MFSVTGNTFFFSFFSQEDRNTGQFMIKMYKDKQGDFKVCGTGRLFTIHSSFEMFKQLDVAILTMIIL